MKENQNHLCGLVIRSNCCCDSHSTTRRVSCKKGSISSAARTRACSPPLLLLLLLWDIARWGDGVNVLESMRIRHPHGNGRAAFSDFSTLRPVFKKVRFQALRFRDSYGRSAKMMQYVCVFEKKRRLDGALDNIPSSAHATLCRNNVLNGRERTSTTGPVLPSGGGKGVFGGYVC